MGKKGRQFINKNDASTSTFNLVNASHDDPRFSCHDNEQETYSYNQVEGTVLKDGIIPMNTLQRCIPRNAAKKKKFLDKVPDSILNVLQPADFGIHKNLPTDHMRLLCKEIYGVEEVPTELQKNSEYGTKLKKDGQKQKIDDDQLDSTDCYFPLDGYDYEQHLRPIQKGGCFVSAKTARNEEIKESLDITNRFTAEEREVLEAMEGYDDGVLEDDFIQTAGGERLLDNNSPSSRVTRLELLWGGYVPELPDRRDAEGTKEINKPATLVSDFEFADEQEQIDSYGRIVKGERSCPINEQPLAVLLAEEYKEEDIGELNEDDDEPLEETLNTISNYDHLLDQYLEDRKKQRNYQIDDGYQDRTESDDDDELGPLGTEAERVLELAQRYLVDEDINKTEDSEWTFLEEPDEKRQQWDCETILSTRSNLFNHPGRVQRPLSSSKLNAIPINAILNAKTVKSTLQAANEVSRSQSSRKLETLEENDKNLECEDNSDDDETIVHLPEVITKRSKDETKEEKKARKAAAKEARRSIRQCKKQNAQILKDANKKLEKIKQSKNPHDVQDGVHRFRL